MGADLEALCREAAMSALRNLMPDIDFKAEDIPYEKLRTLSVRMDDFREALKNGEMLEYGLITDQDTRTRVREA